MSYDESRLLSQIKEKLIASKQLWAKEGRLLTGKSGEGRLPSDRLPPGQRLVKTWPVLDLGSRPDISLETWKLAVDGLVANPLTLDWTAFSRLQQSERVSDIHCVTAWSRYDNVDLPNHLQRRRPSRLLGAARLSQSREPLGRTALRVTGIIDFTMK
jgi:DMSO/TMAO reductase YedYZ molybdopterin-dependent catalytic subunit